MLTLVQIPSLQLLTIYMIPPVGMLSDGREVGETLLNETRLPSKQWTLWAVALHLGPLDVLVLV